MDTLHNQSAKLGQGDRFLHIQTASSLLKIFQKNITGYKWRKTGDKVELKGLLRTSIDALYYRKSPCYIYLITHSSPTTPESQALSSAYTFSPINPTMMSHKLVPRQKTEQELSLTSEGEARGGPRRRCVDHPKCLPY